MPYDERPNVPSSEGVQESPKPPEKPNDDQIEVRGNSENPAPPLSGSDGEPAPSPGNAEEGQARTRQDSKIETLTYARGVQPRSQAIRPIRLRRLMFMLNVFWLSFSTVLMGFYCFGGSPLEDISKRGASYLESSVLPPFLGDGGGDASGSRIVPADHTSEIFKDLLSKLDSSDSSQQRDLQAVSLDITAARSSLSYPEYCYLKGRLAFEQKELGKSLHWLNLLVEVKDSFVISHPEIYYYLGMASSEHSQASAREFLQEFLSKATDKSPLRPEAEKELAELSAKGTPSASLQPTSSQPTGRATSRIFRSEASPSAKVSRIAPGSLALKSKAGETVSLSELNGKLLLLHFWASWCGPCIEELPEFLAFINGNSFKAQKDVFPVIVTEDNSFGDAQYFLDLRKMKISIMYHDPDMGILQELTGKKLVPTTILYDSVKRHTVKVFPEAVDWESKEMRGKIFEIANSYIKSTMSRGEKK